MEENGKLYYKISEVAEMLGENTSLVRFWSDSFPGIIKPRRTQNKNNRIYTDEDIRNLKMIHYLVKDQGLTLEGARRRMEAGIASIDTKTEMLETLRSLRAELKEIHDNI